MEPTQADPEVVALAPETTRRPLIAPMWHTLLLVAVLLGFSFLGSISEHSVATKHGKSMQYALTMTWEWILFGYCWWGMALRDVKLRDVIGGRWARFEDFLLDVALAVGFWIVAALVLGGLGYAMGFGDPQKLQEARKALEFLVPKSRLESFLWIGVSLTAGFCEEVIFRGYLQKQFAQLMGTAWAGILISGAFFGAAHGYEGAKRMVLIGVYGCMFGILAHYRRSLRPGMMTHFLHDTASGLLSRFVKAML